MMGEIRSMLGRAWVLAVVIALCGPAPARAQTDSDRLRLLEKTVEELLERDEEKDKRIRELESQLKAAKRGKIQSAPPPRSGEAGHNHAHAGEAHDDHGGDDVWSREVGDATLRFKRLGLDVTAAAGYESAEQQAITEVLQGHDHDPRQTGFTLQAVDLSFAGALDPYFDSFIGLTYFIDPEGESRFELEEAYLETFPIRGLLDARLKGGQFFTPFGLFNPQHLHDWTWQDAPFIHSRFFGADGLRGQGASAKLTFPLPWTSFANLGVQNAKGETMASFLSSDEAVEELPIGGRRFNEQEVDDFEDLTYHVRLHNDVSLSDYTSVGFGGSALFGPNFTGSGARTTIFGAHLDVTQKLSKMSSVHWTSEFMQRIFRVDVDGQAVAGDPPPEFFNDTLVDWGLYTQLFWAIDPYWGVGFRYGFGTDSGDSIGEFENFNADPFRTTRHRFSPMAQWWFAPTARLRLQYNLDRGAEFLEDDTVHAIWLGLQWSFGLGADAHAGHDDRHNH